MDWPTHLVKWVELDSIINILSTPVIYNIFNYDIIIFIVSEKHNHKSNF